VFVSGWGTSAASSVLNTALPSNASHAEREKRNIAEKLQQTIISRCGYMRNQYYIRVIPQLIGENIINISCGGPVTLCLTKSGEVYSFGYSVADVLGRPNAHIVPQLRMTPGKLDLNVKIVDISAGTAHALLLTGNCSIHRYYSTNKILDEGKVMSFGFDLGCRELCRDADAATQGTPTYIQFTDKVKRIIATRDSSILITIDNEVYVNGFMNTLFQNNNEQEIPLFTQLKFTSEVTSIALGHNYICAVTNDQGHLKTDLLNCRTNGLYDVQLRFKSEQIDITVPAHKSIICSRNFELKEIITKQLASIDKSKKDAIPEIIIDLPQAPLDLSEIEIECFLNYIYSDLFIGNNYSISALNYLADLFVEVRLDQILAEVILNKTLVPTRSTLSNDIERLVNNEEYSDIVFMIRNTTSEDEDECYEIHAHKNIICSRSQYFRALLLNGLEESDSDRIDFSQEEEFVVEYEPFMFVLQYLYTGKINHTLSSKVVCEVAVLAQMWNIYVLQLFCEDWINDHILAIDEAETMQDELHDIDEFAQLYNLKRVQNVCANLLKSVVTSSTSV
jgi:hypothetical protein